MTALHEGRVHERVPFTGQTAGRVRDILPAAKILHRIVTEAEQALGRCAPSRQPSAVSRQ